MDTLAPCRPALAIDVARQLPALPAALLDLLDLLGRDELDIAVLAARLANEPALAATTLRLANSSFYGVSRHVGSLGEASAVLGLRTLRSVVTTAALTGSFAPPACEGFDLALFWRHAIGVAVAARRLAAELGLDAESAFTAGLLHDIGRLVLASGFPQRYAEVLAHGDSGGAELGECERRVLGTDHAAVGALVAERWRLPAPIVAAIGAHHGTPAAGAAPTLAGIVQAADLLAQAMEAGGATADEVSAECLQAWTCIGLPATDLERVVAQIDLQRRAICAALLS